MNCGPKPKLISMPFHVAPKVPIPKTMTPLVELIA